MPWAVSKPVHNDHTHRVSATSLLLEESPPQQQGVWFQGDKARGWETLGRSPLVLLAPWDPDKMENTHTFNGWAVGKDPASDAQRKKERLGHI